MRIARKDISGRRFYRLSRTPPAFCGVLVDWSIGTREMTSTILDLIVRDYLAVVGNRVIRASKKSKRVFENKFMDRLFDSKKSLTYEEVKKKAYGSAYDDLLKIIADGMIAEGVIDKNFQKKLVKHMIEILDEFSVIDPAEQSINQDIPISERPKPIMVPPGVGYGIVGSLIILTILFRLYFPWGLGFTLPILLFLVVAYSYTSRVDTELEKRLGKTMDWILTKKGKTIKSQSLELKKFMKNYPLAEDRLANILVGHAVAFGFGKVWAKKLGKDKIPFLNFAESISSHWETMYKFMDVASFVYTPELNMSARRLKNH